MAAATSPAAVDEPALTEERATDILLDHPKVAAWLDRYPPNPQTSAEYRRSTDQWIVKAWSGKAGQIVFGKVADDTGVVAEAWTGPQVAWSMARGGAGAFGGKTINKPWLWLAFCAAFLVGLANLRRPSPCATSTCSHCSRSRSRSGSSTRARSSGAPPSPTRRSSTCSAAVSGSRGATGRREPRRRSGRSWLLAAAAVFLTGFRVGLNVDAQRSVIDVGFAGVVGAHRIANGEMPYGHMPVQEDLTPCGPADAEGEIRERVQTNGRCEASNPRGDTYGPVSYLAYLPGYAVFGWTGKWDELWAAHATSLLFDALCLAGLVLVGRRSAARGWPRRSRSRGRPTRSRSTPPTRTRTTRSCPRS